MAITRIGNIANTIPDDSISNSKFTDIVNFKNIIINGDMSIAQRATSATGLGNGDTGYHTVDRYKFQEVGAPTFEFTQSQSTDVPSGQGFANSLKMDCTTAQGSLASGDAFNIQQGFEGQNLQYLKYGTSSAESLTLSFWVKSNKTGTYTVEFEETGNARHFCKTYTIDSASTWEKKTITISGDTVSSLANDNTLELRPIWWLGAGTNWTSGTLATSGWSSQTTANRVSSSQVNLADDTSNEWLVTGVQLEAGTTASDFEFLPVDVNLARCQRYLLTFGNSNNFIGHFYATNTVNASIYFPNKLRADPTVSCTSLTNSIRVYSAGVLRYSSTFADNGVTAEQGELSASVTGGTAGNALTANINNGGFLLQFDAEL